MALTGQHACTGGTRHNNGECGFSPLSVKGATMCQCSGYPATTLSGDCTVCGGGYYESIDDFCSEISGGFVESKNTDNFPVNIICYRGEKTIPVCNVRMDSISVSESKVKGYVDIAYEVYGDVVGICGVVPMVDYYTTEDAG